MKKIIVALYLFAGMALAYSSLDTDEYTMTADDQAYDDCIDQFDTTEKACENVGVES